MNEWRMMSIGEAIDKYMILKVKCEKLSGENYKMVKAQHDFMLAGLEKHTDMSVTSTTDILKLTGLMFELHGNHRIQWDAEDAVFSATNAIDGIKAAKLSRKYNIRRAEIKKEIDIIFSEKFLEIKDYAKGNELD